MDQQLKEVLAGRGENHLLPFFWQHGEDEATLREYVNAIHGAGCGAFCVESRPHPDFCGPKWWQDMDVILDEAKKLRMKVWILDDSHFPTGFANGTLKDAPAELCRQSIFCRTLRYGKAPKTVTFRYDKLKKPPKYKMGMFAKMVTKTSGPQREYDDDAVYSVTAFGPQGETLDLTGRTVWEKPQGEWEVRVCGLSRNCGPHRNYINMMDRESCRKLIDACYEPHYERYKDLFGATIAGFFSDEPELGNGILYAQHNVLGTEQDLPWSRELEAALENKLGTGWKNRLPLLWKNDGDPQQTGELRRAYMDEVTRLVSEDFSRQLGTWCREHGVEYIGHLIEDCDTHTCTGSGLGHFFRGEAGQDMAGIDDIGGQVISQGEEKPKRGMAGPRKGSFYHYTLGKLGTSAAYLDPKKKGRCLCEIFGAYGWKTGVSDMKYLADHFLVRGVNYFVPHAFSPKAYPDPDCPPHFYAHGNNPQYRHIGELFRYMNRVSCLIDHGRPVLKTAVFYNAEADWAGEAEAMDKTTRVLFDNRIDFVFLPLDELKRAGEFEFVLVTPGKYQPAELLKLPNAVFVDRLPERFLGKAENEIDRAAPENRVVPKSKLVRFLTENGVRDAKLSPADPYVHCLHYKTDCDLYLFNNEGKETYRGTVTVPVTGPCFAYNAWDNRLEAVSHISRETETVLNVAIEPRKSLLIFFDDPEGQPLAAPLSTAVLGKPAQELKRWRRSTCRAAAYPDFASEKPVSLPDPLEQEQPEFSGFVRYETDFNWAGGNGCALEITGPCEGVEVFANGVSAGIQIVPPYRFDLSSLVHGGENRLRIELATTLDRENTPKDPAALLMAGGKPTSRTGLHGKVRLIKL